MLSQLRPYSPTLLIQSTILITPPSSGKASFPQVRLIRNHLKTLCAPNAPQATTSAALFAWIDLMLNADAMAAYRLQTIGLASGTVKALRAGLEVMKRRRVGRLRDAAGSPAVSRNEPPFSHSFWIKDRPHPFRKKC
jgi:hypothetical protein